MSIGLFGAGGDLFWIQKWHCTLGRSPPSTHDSAFPRRRSRPGSRINFVPPNFRGRRESRALVRTRSLACESEKHASKVTTGMPEATGLPCAIGLTAYSALFPVIGL